MSKRTLVSSILLFVFSIFTAVPAYTQETCNNLPPRLTPGGGGQVAYTDGAPLNIRAGAGRSNGVVNTLPEGTLIDVLEGPICADAINWWHIQSGAVNGWIAEAADNVYLVEPRVIPLPISPPVQTLSQGVPFARWDWKSFVGDGYRSDTPDPLGITLPPVYAGNMPTLPVSLDGVLFVENAGLNTAQMALLARNGFVVIPAGLKHFYDAYRDSDTWDSIPAYYDPNDKSALPGNPYFITTDSTLHALHFIFDNLLTDLEKDALITHTQSMTAVSLNAAAEQYKATIGTPLETPARNAVLYLLVGTKLLAPDSTPTGIPDAIVAEANTLVSMATAGEGQLPISFLQGYMEDFSQYRPRGHYAGDATLENYFRGMMWLSRITFLANDDTQTLTALLLLRALQVDGLADWQTVHDTLTFLIGPVDDLSPSDYVPLASEIFGADLTLDSLGDTTKLATFRERLAALPGPRINGLILPNDTEAGEEQDLTRGFRLMGQRFTFDGYVMQQLMSPYVGTRENPRPLPLGLDVAAVIGSDVAYNLAAQAGALSFEHYDTQVAALRGQVASLSQDNWLENTYSGWLWALQPLWVRDAAVYPPLMNTDAWLRRDIQAGLGSWTELKHDTVLYTKQPTGFGGGGPPLASFGYVEPNPLVFARISAIAALTSQGLSDHGLANLQDYANPALVTSANELHDLAILAAELAVIANKELTGEPLSDDDYFRIQLYGQYLNTMIRTLYQGEGEPPPVALVTDVANNPGAQSVLQEGVGGVDYIYVVIPTLDGRLQIARGGVFSYYEFVNNINQRMTDEEWRNLVQSGNLPPRPAWVSTFLGE